MSHRWLAVPLVLVLAAGTASADGTPPAGKCEIDYAPAVACRLSDTVAADGTHTMVFDAGGRKVEFVGKSQTGWWSGKLDGRPAMGREIDRSHIMFSTVDLQFAFEWRSR